MALAPIMRAFSLITNLESWMAHSLKGVLLVTSDTQSKEKPGSPFGIEREVIQPFMANSFEENEIIAAQGDFHAGSSFQAGQGSL